MRRNPIHHLLDSRQPEWGSIAEMPVVLRFEKEQVEQRALKTLALCDVSGLPKLGVKGPDAATWLASQGIDVPPNLFDTRRLADGGIIARVGGDDFFLESGIACDVVPRIAVALDTATAGVVRIERQETGFLVAGPLAMGLLSQTCAINFAETQAGLLVQTRVAGVSCSILPDTVNGVPLFRIWADCSYAVYLWETLAEICEDLDGTIVGAACLGMQPR